MTRHTRPQAERLEAIALTVNRTGNAVNVTFGLYVAAYALAGAGVGYLIRDSWRAVAGGAGIGAFVGLLLFTAAAWGIAHDALARQGGADEDEWDFARTAPGRLSRLPDGVTALALWSYLIDIASGSVTLSQRGAAAHGFSQATANAIKDWVIGLGWYTVTNEGNAAGDWTEDGERVLSLLRRTPPATWNQIVEEMG